MERAVRATADILGQYQHVISSLELVTGTKGAFEVTVNDTLIFSKQTMQKRHAEPGEVLALFKEIVGPKTPTYGT